MRNEIPEKKPATLTPALSRVQGESPPTYSPKLAAAYKAEFNPAITDSVFEKTPCVSFTTDETETNEQDTVTQMNERRKWRRATFAVVIASLIASLISCAASFFASATVDSSAVLASALDTLLAVFSACVVIWRFSDERNDKTESEREKYGSIAFGIAFIVNSVVTIAVSSFHLVDKNKPKHSDLLWPVLLVFSFIYCVLAVMEYWICKRFKSSVLFSLCIDDAVTSGLLFGLFVSALLLDQIAHIWYLDHVVAIALAVVILACGVKIFVDIFVYKKLPFQMFGSTD